MDWRKIESDPKLADNKGETFHSKDSLGQKALSSIGAAACTARKPSERFVKRPLAAKSRASQSERFRIAVMKEKLNTVVVETMNEQSVFNGYRPGHEALPG